MNIYPQIHRVPFCKADGCIPKPHDKYGQRKIKFFRNKKNSRHLHFYN